MPRPNIDVAVISVTDETMTSTLEFLVQLIEQDVAE